MRSGPQIPADFIVSHLPVVPVPGLPHIRLHTATPKSGVWRLAGDGEPPYWAWSWPGGQALARHLLASPRTVAGQAVLDLGTGSGLVAIAAGLAGARTVSACDIDPNALAAARLNADLNGTEIDFVLADPLDGPVPEVAVVLAGDIFYAPGLAARATVFFDRCLDRGLTILVGDIGRAFLPRRRLAALSSWPVTDFGDGAAAMVREAMVYRVQRADDGAGPLQSCA